MDFQFETEKLYGKTNRIYKILGLVLLIVAVAGATYPFWGSVIVGEPSALEQLGQSELNAKVLAENANPQISGSENTAPTAISSKPQNKIAQNRLIIDSAGVDMPLFLSASDKTLSKGGWMYSGNSTPDRGGNTVIFGHRWLYRPPLKNTFYNLDKAKVGDKFSVSWNGKTYNYQVSEIKIVEPTDVWVMNPTDSPQITLITCTPLFSTKQRLVIIGKLI